MNLLSFYLKVSACVLTGRKWWEETSWRVHACFILSTQPVWLRTNKLNHEYFLLHRAFFSSSASGTSKKNESKKTPTKKRKERQDEEEVTTSEGPVTDASESPVLKSKSKRRRVIVDSDSEEEEGVRVGGSGGVENVERCGGEEVEMSEEVQMKGLSSEVTAGENSKMDDSGTDNTNCDIKTNGQVSTQQLLSPVRPTRAQQVANDDESTAELVKTPPKRSTGVCFCSM